MTFDKNKKIKDNRDNIKFYSNKDSSNNLKKHGIAEFSEKSEQKQKTEFYKSSDFNIKKIPLTLPQNNVITNNKQGAKDSFSKNKSFKKHYKDIQKFPIKVDFNRIFKRQQEIKIKKKLKILKLKKQFFNKLRRLRRLGFYEEADKIIQETKAKKNIEQSSVFSKFFNDLESFKEYRKGRILTHNFSIKSNEGYEEKKTPEIEKRKTKIVSQSIITDERNKRVWKRKPKTVKQFGEFLKRNHLYMEGYYSSGKRMPFYRIFQSFNKRYFFYDLMKKITRNTRPVNEYVAFHHSRRLKFKRLNSFPIRIRPKVLRRFKNKHKKKVKLDRAYRMLFRNPHIRTKGKVSNRWDFVLKKFYKNYYNLSFVLSTLSFFKSAAEVNQNINYRHLTVNQLYPKNITNLSEGDIVEYSTKIISVEDIEEGKKHRSYFYPFIEIEDYTQTMSVIKNVNELSKEDAFLMNIASTRFTDINYLRR